jgi:hypothetical protein
MAVGGRPDAVHQDVRTKRAVDLAAKFIKDLHTINDPDFEGLKEYFSAKEISELCAFMVFVSASHKFGVLMDVGPEDAPEYPNPDKPELKIDD